VARDLFATLLDDTAHSTTSLRQAFILIQVTVL